MKSAQLSGLMWRRYLGRAVNAVFAIEEGADSPGISTAHQAVDFWEAAAFEQSNDGSPVGILAGP